MIVNPLGVVAAFVCALEFVLGAATLVLAVRAMLHRSDVRDAAADARRHLLMLLAATSLGLSAVGWPLFYAVLQSYVPRWPGVMCIQGVARVGTGSAGASAALPSLIGALNVLRPAAVFVAGSWVALHVADRRARTSPLRRTVTAFLVVAGATSLAAAAVESAYLFIPKEERFLADGCCTMPTDWTTGSGDPLVARWGEDGARRAATALFFVVGAAYAGASAWSAFGGGEVLARRAALAANAVCGFAFLGAAGLFAVDAASPVLLRLPHHRCAWCLFASAPETLVGAALVVVAAFAGGWAAILAWAGPVEDGRAEMERQVRAVLRAGVFGAVGAIVFAASELAAA